MSKMIQVRNVPDSAYRILKALAGMSLSDFLLMEMRQLAERPSVAELRERVRNRSRTAPICGSGGPSRARCTMIVLDPFEHI